MASPVISPEILSILSSKSFYVMRKQRKTLLNYLDQVYDQNDAFDQFKADLRLPTYRNFQIDPKWKKQLLDLLNKNTPDESKLNEFEINERKEAEALKRPSITIDPKLSEYVSDLFSKNPECKQIALFFTGDGKLEPVFLGNKETQMHPSQQVVYDGSPPIVEEEEEPQLLASKQLLSNESTYV